MLTLEEMRKIALKNKRDDFKVGQKVTVVWEAVIGSNAGYTGVIDSIKNGAVHVKGDKEPIGYGQPSSLYIHEEQEKPKERLNVGDTVVIREKTDYWNGNFQKHEFEIVEFVRGEVKLKTKVALSISAKIGGWSWEKKRNGTFYWPKEQVFPLRSIGTVWKEVGGPKVELVLTANTPYGKKSAHTLNEAYKYGNPNAVALMNISRKDMLHLNPFQTWAVIVKDPENISDEEWKKIAKLEVNFVQSRVDSPKSDDKYSFKAGSGFIEKTIEPEPVQIMHVEAKPPIKEPVVSAPIITKATVKVVKKHKKSKKRKVRKKGMLTMTKKYRVHKGELGGRVMESSNVSKCGTFVFFDHLDKRIRVHTKHLTELTEENFVDTTAKGNEDKMSELRSTAFGYVTSKNVKRIEALKLQLLERTDTNIAEITAIRQGTGLSREMAKKPKPSFWTPERIMLAAVMALLIISMVL